jgi:hypothetical protein
MENIRQATIGPRLLVSKLGTKAFPGSPRTNWTEIRKSHPRRLSEKDFKLLDLFAVQQQQVHKLRIQF